MADIILILFAGFFLPLFPMSMVFNAVNDRIGNAGLRAALYIAWPLVGIGILLNSELSIPGWVLPLALVTSALYALRMLTLREVNQWSGFLATSLWSLLWLALIQENQSGLLYSFALSMSMPLVLLGFLSAGLEKRYGAAYTGLYGGLARTIPRFSGVLVTVVVASIATPFFPTFYILFDLVVESVSTSPYVALAILFTWLLWGWAGTRLIQGLIVGRASDVRVVDMTVGSLSVYTLVLLALAVSGVYLGGVIL